MKRPIITLVGITLLIGACEARKTDAVETQRVTSPGSAPATLSSSIAIRVDASGYHPESVQAQSGKPARLVFTRTTDEGCGQQLVFPALGIRKDLPLNQPVEVDVTMPASGDIAFTCGMNMLRGSLVAQ